MKYFLALAVIGNGLYWLARGDSLAGSAEIFLAVAALVGVIIYQHAEYEKELERKKRLLHVKSPRRRN